MDGLATIFADVTKRGLVKNYFSYKAVLYGANYHDIFDKGHWIEVMASILKLKTKVDLDRVKTLLRP